MSLSKVLVSVWLHPSICILMGCHSLNAWNFSVRIFVPFENCVRGSIFSNCFCHLCRACDVGRSVCILGNVYFVEIELSRWFVLSCWCLFWFLPVIVHVSFTCYLRVESKFEMCGPLLILNCLRDNIGFTLFIIVGLLICSTVSILVSA